ncbi:DNA excision repair protein ERCC-6-like 2 [Protopterus annectens]|uniref:DNA excision repair protein ERCC-6-like 2 n=1 Tax=Protopterus annectens TaxID=7888 RepID=UPI001CFC33CE|nr:DNA excision repair protein ERCC-6-like 2 [Protopterus annectens]
MAGHSAFDDGDLEKPYFHGRTPPGPALPFKLFDKGDYIPFTINRYLRDYQREGTKFIYRHYVQRQGCILGDDMGLGKTVQVISFLAAALQKTGTREDIENNMPEFLLKTVNKRLPSVSGKMFLVVAPLSVLYNWKDELDTWGHFKVAILHGNKKENEISRIRRGKVEVALTTYDTLRLCIDEINSIVWSAIIVDEVHKLKNPKSQITKVMKSLKCKIRIGLTGTILQNNMEELWCVVDWAVPGCLGNKNQFNDEFATPLERGQRHTATKRELATGRKVMKNLAKKMSVFFLRRTKALISGQLPKKEDRVVYCSMTEFQKLVYRAVLETEDVSLVLHGWKPCKCSSGKRRKECCYKTNCYGTTVRQLYFSYLAILRKVANHVALLQPDESMSKLQDSNIRRVCEQVFSKFPDFVQQSKDASFETISDPKYSGKMKVLQRLLDHCRNNRDKVLLFSFSTKLLDVLERYCMASGLDYRRLDGNTKTEDRVKIVKEFNISHDVNICLVSTMAGGLGLNFVGANVVILFDPTWNPANDLQAIDRAYRIGQCRDVRVFRLISLGTVEEIIYLRQLYKQQLQYVAVESENAKRYFVAMQGMKGHTGELFGIHNVFRFRNEGSCLTKDIIEREGRVEAGVVTTKTCLKEESPTPRPEKTLDTDCENVEEERKLQDELEKKNLMDRKEAALMFDFSSDSEDEPGGVTTAKEKMNKSRISVKDVNANSRGQLTLLQCGFSRLLEAKKGSEIECSDSDGLSDEPSSDESDTEISEDCSLLNKTNNHKGKTSGQQGAPQFPYYIDKEGHEPKASEHNISAYGSSKEMARTVERQREKPISENVNFIARASRSDDSDVIFPAQTSTLKKNVFDRNEAKCVPPSKFSEDSDNERYTTISAKTNCYSRSSKGLYGNKATLKSVRGKPLSPNENLHSDSQDGFSDESDDVEFNTVRHTRENITDGRIKGKGIPFKSLDRHKESRVKSHNRHNLERESQSIGNFSSSEDELPTKKFKSSKRFKHTRDRKYSRLQLDEENRSSSRQEARTSNLKTVPVHTADAKEKNVNQENSIGSMDKFLDGVQEVAYIHSNQRVVGSSKAENHLSKSAVHHVFKLNQFSQLPANAAIYNSEVSAESDDQADRTSQKESKRQSQHLFHVTHPVTQTEKSVHQADQTMFFIGETPKGIRRKELTRMMSYFNLTTLEDLAKYIVEATSETRKSMLRNFYGTQYPELKEVLSVKAPPLPEEKPPPLPGEKPSPLPKEEHTTLKKSMLQSTKKNTHKSNFTCKSLAEQSFKEGTSNLSREVKKSQVTCFKNNSTVDSHSVPGSLTSASQNKEESYKGLCSSSTRRISVRFENTTNPLVSEDEATVTTEEFSNNEPNIKANLFSTHSQQNCEVQPGVESIRKKDSKADSISELLGDTSILNDFFKRKKNTDISFTREYCSEPVVKAKHRTKDFWDILNEGDEDSVSKLVDLSEVEKICDSTSQSFLKNKDLNNSLWKRNERFLWKNVSLEDELQEATPDIFDSELWKPNPKSQYK